MRPAHWTHEKASFFKYASSETGRIVLTERKLRWSAPTRFNDPFDIQFDLHPDYGPDAITKTVDWMWDALHNRPDLRKLHLAGIPEKRIRQTLTLLGKERFQRELAPFVRSGHAQLPELTAKTQTELRAFFSRMLVLCLSEVCDNILMWSHYADMHRGLVLEFACIPSLDSCWGVAEPVRYASEMPKMFTEEYLTSPETSLDDPKTMFRKMVYTKALDWQYEKEWRIVQIRPQTTPDYEDLTFQPTELSSIRLGCRMQKDQRVALTTIAESLFPGVKLFQARKAPRRFAIEFEQIA